MKWLEKRFIAARKKYKYYNSIYKTVRLLKFTNNCFERQSNF